MVNLLGKVPNQQSVERLECWIWDQVYTKSAISVLSLATCMVMDVVFSSQWKQMPSKLLGWCSGRKSVGSTGVARLLVASRYAHPPRWACRVLRMLPPRWLHEVSDSSSGLVSRMKEALQCEVPSEWVWHVHCVCAGWSLWCVCWQGQAGQEENVWHGSEGFRTRACVAVHKCSRWNETEVQDPAPVSWVCVHVACDLV